MAPLNPDFINVFLENFHTFQESGNEDSRLFLMDINTAMYNAPLTSLERRVINQLFIEPPTPPQRDVPDKDGFTRGRPAGGTTQAMLCEQLGLDKSTLSNLKWSAIVKMAAYLGDEYEV
jgi:hypothetical protein